MREKTNLEKMQVIVKYEILDYNNLIYGMFKTDSEMIRNLRIEDECVPLGGTASNLSWLQQDVHRSTEEIKSRYGVKEVEYVLMEMPKMYWQNERNKSAILKLIEEHCPNAIVSNRQREALAGCLAEIIPQWIPINEGLPTEEGWYLASLSFKGRRCVHELFFNAKRKTFHIGMEGADTKEGVEYVIAYMMLPKAFEK